MTRRSKASGKVPKASRRQGVSKRGKPTVSRPRSSAGDQKTEIARLARELHDAHERQAATVEILKVISRSSFDLQTVFDTLVKSATHLCEAQDAFIFLPDGEVFRAAARFGFTPEYHKFVEANPVKVDRGSVTGRTAIDGRVVHVSDVLADPDFTRQDLQKIGGFRAGLGVPLLREKKVIGVIFLSRTKPQPFTEKQIELIKNFAIQAVIAIENARLLNQLRQRTDDLSESLEQQTATSEVLQVISSSPGELELVFESMLENAVRICEASFGNLLLYENEAFRHVALHNAPKAWAAEQKRDPIAPRDSARFLYRVADTKQVTHISDVAADNPDEPIAKVAGARTLLIVPMLKESELIGVIAIYRQEVRAFTDKQVELVKNFAAQAVIAIENSRLLNELRESLRQQTATAEVLKVISSSPGELEPVFKAMLANAVEICEAKFGVLFRYQGSEFYPAAWVGVPRRYEEFNRRRGLFRPDPGAPLDRLLRTKELVQTADELAEHSSSPAARYGGARSLVAVPMFK